MKILMRTGFYVSLPGICRYIYSGKQGYKEQKVMVYYCICRRGTGKLSHWMQIAKGVVGSVLLVFLLSSCSKTSEHTEVFEPRIEEVQSPTILDRKREFCSPEKVSFQFLNSKTKFIRTEEFKNFFDCANYDFKYQGLEPLVHSQAFPGFLENLVDSVNTIGNASSTKNIKATLEPWFEEHQKTGESKIDHLLPVVAKIIKHSIFRKALPLLATIMDGGNSSWNLMLESFSYLVYNPGYPNIWADFRKLFNVRTTSKKINHLAVTTRDFFEFLKQEQVWTDGKKKTNARAFLEFLEGFNHFNSPPTGFLSLVEYANNRDVFVNLYQAAGGAMRGEGVFPELNGSKGTDPEVIEQVKKEKVNQLFAWDENKKSSQLLELIKLVVDFNQKKPDFLPAISRWFNKEENQNRMQKGMVEFVARRLASEIVGAVPMARFLNDYYRKVLGSQLITKIKDPSTGEEKEVKCSGLDCEVDSERFSRLLSEAFQHEQFQTWLVKWLEQENSKKFKEKNMRLLMKHGGLQADIQALYQDQNLITYTKNLIDELKNKATSKFTLRTAINSFSKFHILEAGRVIDDKVGPIFIFREKNQYFYDHLTDAWLRNSEEAWGDSVLVQEAFRVIDLFLSEFADDLDKKKDPTTLSQLFFSSTYSDPVMMEKLIFEAKRSGIYAKIEKNIPWLRDEFAKEVFRNDEDLVSFQRAVNLIPTYVLYVESGMARSGLNLTRTLSERDSGYMIRSYVNLITEGYHNNWITNALPLWKNFIDFMDKREQRVKKAVAEAKEEMSVEENEIEALREARRQSDGVDALKRVFKYLFRPKKENDWNTSLASQILVPLKELVSKDKIDETERFILHVAEKTVTASDKEIEDVYEFFSPNDGLGEILNPAEEDFIRDAKFRKNLAELMRTKSFPQVLIELDRLFKDEAVIPSLDFLAAKIDEGGIKNLLELIRKLLGIKAFNQ